MPSVYRTGMHAAVVALACGATPAATPSGRRADPVPETVLQPTEPAPAPALEWSSADNAPELSWTEAIQHCERARSGWRLPNKRELLSLLADPHAETEERAFRSDAPPLPKDGYLWSGELVHASRRGQAWIMNLANGHVFNGSGYTGHAMCVRGEPMGPPKRPPGTYDATIGPADAKLTIIVAAQMDFHWHRVRPTLTKLLAKYPVRFEWKHYPVFPRMRAVALGLCAAARAGKFTALEKRLLDAGPSAKPDDAALRDLALAAGVGANAYDASVAGPCKTIVELDAEEMGARGVDGVPTFLIGDQQLQGSEPIEEFEAAIDAAIAR